MKREHLEQGYQQDLDDLSSRLRLMADRAREMLARSLEALEQGDRGMARRVVGADAEVNDLEREIDERGLRLLARWQPVAGDLRLVATAFKVVTDLERIADHAVAVAQGVLTLGTSPTFRPVVDVVALGQLAAGILHDALTALDREDPAGAAEVVARGPRVEVLAEDMLRGSFLRPGQDPQEVATSVHLHRMAGYLQRVAAHAVNIAEMVIFLVQGRDVRHQPVPEPDRAAVRPA